MTLPDRPRQEAHGEQPGSARPGDAAPRVLVVDDNPLNVELVHFVLTAAGFEVLTAGDGPRALEMVAQARPAMILMDVQLPGTDGLALTRRLKADPATRDIVIVAFTAYAMKGDEIKMLAAGCDGYLSKPIVVATFAGTVRSLLQAGAARAVGAGATGGPSSKR